MLCNDGNGEVVSAGEVVQVGKQSREVGIGEVIRPQGLCGGERHCK